MLKNYLKIALRNLRRHRGYAFINMFGLALGMACCLLIVLYVLDELSYDRFHEKADRTYRVVTDVHPPEDGPTDLMVSNGWPVGRTIQAEYPEVEHLVYLQPWSLPITHENRYFYETIYAADTSVFEVFSFPLLHGDPKTALQAPFSLVITEEMSHKYFGTEHALGQTLTLRDSLEFTITGVVQNVPRHSHLQFDMLASFSSICALGPNDCSRWLSSGWSHMNVYNYVLLRKGADGKAFEEKIKDLVTRHASDRLREWGYTYTLRLHPLQDIYLRSDRGNRLGPQSNITYVYFLLVIALFILLIACINFMNLATARSTDRAKEVGVRKVVGSSRAALIRQFLSESFLACLLALVLALGLLSVALPFFNTLAEKEIVMSALLAPRLTFLLTGLVLLVSLLAGLYPAFVLSGYRPIEALKGAYATKGQGIRLRQALVVFQFAISCILIVSTLVVWGQLHYMQNQDLGFDKQQVIVLNAQRTSPEVRARQYEDIKQALLKHPSTQRASALQAVPGRNGWRHKIVFPEGLPKDEGLITEYLAVDHEYMEMFGLELIAGRNFSKAFVTDEENALLINEAAVQAMGWKTPENALGKRIDAPSGYPSGIVLGVVKDYHQHGLQEDIGSLVLDVNPGAFQHFALRAATTDIPAVLAHMEATWNHFFPGHTFDYFFLGEDYDRQYQAEQQLTKIFGTFASLAILISCLGIFGLAAFIAMQRTKEIGIRKVLGASVPGIVFLLSKDLVRLVLIAIVVAAPIGYLAMNRWLDAFAYRIEMSWHLFLVAGLSVLGIALLTVSYQSIKAALVDPVKALRYE